MTMDPNLDLLRYVETLREMHARGWRLDDLAGVAGVPVAGPVKRTPEERRIATTFLGWSVAATEAWQTSSPVAARLAEIRAEIGLRQAETLALAWGLSPGVATIIAETIRDGRARRPA